ncbi:MAG: hypothetical protein LJE61_10445 [Thiocapsa sp.]|jgi:hypothetical protein|nr:hypothetical protein [Thiocapsa sp.]MCG6897415.1 hypothetical protein [Thiocapsa sp.]MCG6985598.1 hypothetical protein [Thiocapsa sp.]
MRPLRWKSRYQTGDAEVDRHHRAFVDCLNRLIQGAGQREHCREMEDFIARFSAEAEEMLQDRRADLDLSAEFGRRLLASLPLEPYGSAACRACGLCDLAKEQIAEHLQAPAECLFRAP